MRFADRAEAGRALAARLTAYANRADVVVLGLARGGMPVAAEVARALAAPLDVLLVRKLGAPDQPELAIGAIAEDGVALINDDVLRGLGLGPDAIDRATARERPELDRRLAAYRRRAARRSRWTAGWRSSSTTASPRAPRWRPRAAPSPRAAPPASSSRCPSPSREASDRLRTVAHEVVAVATPAPFYAVGAWYVDFRQTDDREVVDLLAGAAR